jgi:PKD repeat protein
VAPDGTVWLPVNQCAGSQGGVFSTDGGTTWTEFKVPGAVSQTNGADPSIAIDDKSNIYYSYVNSEKVPTGQPAEGHPRVVAGHLNADNTITWSTPVDLGTTHGIKNAAEIEAVGGSTGRAAVGFIASDVPGDYQALSYPGRWYAFIATTYDGGNTWTTVNATPNDPVQSHTGVWQQGGGAQDRNLLDFNEITVDDKGRVLYGYSDGCVTTGCIADTAGNDFTAYMRVARQSGGRSIFASFDGKTDTTVAVPAKAACLSGLRDASGSHLTWKAPDNGGAEITNYYIYRGTVAGGENFTTPIGQSTGKTTYTDATADPAVPDYFYVVKAITSAGFGAVSNEIDLKLSNTPVVIQTPCALPGLTVLTDKPNDELDSVPAHDVQLLAIGEPFAFGDKLVFTLKVQSLATLPPATEWPITFTGANGTKYTVQMTTLQADDPANPTISTNPEFQVGPSSGTLVAADPASKYTPDGTITIVVPKSSVGSPKIGDKLTAFLVRITAGLITPDNMPDSLAPSGSYTVVGNATFCAPNAAPTAILSGTPDHGPAPLTVNFTGSGTDPDNDAIASYTFDFGDGSPVVTQTSPTISHTYNAAGEFRAQLQVTDARGKLSTNTALFPVDVSAVLRNISTRANVQTGDNVLIGGLIISGNSPRTIVVRGIGPSLKANSLPLAGALQDPTIELHNSSGIVATNDNWKTDDATGQSQQAAVENTGLAPTDDRESAIVKSLSPGLYTVVMRGAGSSTGLGVVEAYDVDPTGVSKLANLSTRALVGTGDNIVIGGFIVGPTNAANMKLLLRGIGPSLSNSNVPSPLQDPVLDVRDSNGNRIGSNNDWKDSQQADRNRADR